MSSIECPNLLQSLINVSEKAANIARICRSNEQLLSLLVQEKTGNEANARFEHDFKTLADVLIQETIKHDIGNLFPSMRNAIRGEESPIFKNAQDKEVSITIGATEEDTVNMLATVLHKYKDAAKALAKEVHQTVSYTDLHIGDIPTLPTDLDYDNLGIWIDPIDATAEYIAGDSMFTNFPGITSSGLDCVTVLIGVYEATTGMPVIGVVSQPFKNKIEKNVYRSQVYWGVALPNLKANNCANIEIAFEEQIRNLRCILSTSEQVEILQQMQHLSYEFVFSAGAGHKALKVISEEVDIYILSKGSTFKWDTCAPQAILRSCDGDILDYKQSIAAERPISLSYLETDGKCNSGGLIAYRHINLVEDLLLRFANKSDA